MVTKRMNKITRLITCIGMSIVLYACGMLDPVYTPNVNHYQINAMAYTQMQQCNKQTSSAGVNDTIIQITRVRAFAPFDTRDMLYSVAKYQLDSYSIHKWITPVDAMLTKAIQEKLLNSCIFGNVVNADFMTSAKYRLNSQLLNLTQNIDNHRQDATLNFSILEQLVDNNSNQVIKSKIFNLSVPVSANPQGYVEGTNLVVKEFLQQLVIWLSPSIQPYSAVTTS